MSVTSAAAATSQQSLDQYLIDEIGKQQIPFTNRETVQRFAARVIPSFSKNLEAALRADGRKIGTAVQASEVVGVAGVLFTSTKQQGDFPDSLLCADQGVIDAVTCATDAYFRMYLRTSAE